MRCPKLLQRGTDMTIQNTFPIGTYVFGRGGLTSSPVEGAKPVDHFDFCQCCESEVPVDGDGVCMYCFKEIPQE
jgi:hypothetical protein